MFNFIDLPLFVSCTNGGRQSTAMKGFRGSDLLMVSVAMLCWATCHSINMELARLLQAHGNYNHDLTAAKRTTDGNPCPTPEKPFPCRTTTDCIPLHYVCDNNVDCVQDAFDEDEELCIATRRPAFDEITNFLMTESNWIIPNLFANKNLGLIAHGLTVSQSVDDFRRRLGMSTKEMSNLKAALRAVDSGDQSAMQRLGMPSSAWNEVTYIFNKLIEGGFRA